MIKKKGQIVPKNIVRAIERRSQHLVKFGCDCEVINNKVYPMVGGDVFVIPSTTHVRIKKGKRKVKGFDGGNCSVDCSKYGAVIRSCFYIESPSPKFQLDSLEFNS